MAKIKKDELKKETKKQDIPVTHERKHKTNNTSGLKSGVNKRTYG